MNDQSYRSTKTRSGVTRAVLSLFLKRGTVLSNVPVAEGFHLVELGGPDLVGTRWLPGQQIQIAMGGLSARTYTPIEWDSEAGRTRLLAFAHGSGPGSDWVRGVKAGASCSFFGPRVSVELSATADPCFIFGDETSSALAACAIGMARKTPLRCLFEVGLLDRATNALDAVSLHGARLFQRVPGDRHLRDLAAMLQKAAREGATIVLTGKAGSVQQLHYALKPLGVPTSRLLTKAYWATGKAGLD